MASARELLEQADALMRRNRAGMIDTEIPELREVISMVALAPAATPTALEDVPELTEAVEEIEISSIVELPEDIDESSGWLHHDHGELKVVSTGPDSMIARFPKGGESDVAPMPARSALAIVEDVPVTTHREPVAAPAVVPAAAPVEAPPVEAPPVAAPPVAAPPVAAPLVAAPLIVVSPVAAPPVVVSPVEAPTVVLPPVALSPGATPVAAPNAAAAPAASPAAPSTDEWARWEALADEIRMQVLQRIDLFTEARLHEELSAHLQPIVDRASVEMVATINERVGGLIRAYIAEAIEREIEKWRGATR